MGSRRDFFGQGGALFALLCIAPRSLGSTSRAAAAHHLFFDDADLPRLRHSFNESPIFAELRERLTTFDRQEARHFLREEVRYNDQLYDIKTVGDIIEDMAFYYRLTGDADAAALAIEAVEALMKFEKWDYFLEGGRDMIGLQRAPNSTIATSVASDWLHDAISTEQRERWVRTMAERGIEPSFRSIYGMRYPDRVVGWSLDPESTYLEHRPDDAGLDLSRWPIILDSTNLKAHPAAAVVVGAVVYARTFGENADTERWLEQAEFSIRSYDELYEPDGSYPEGLAYGNYTAVNLATATSALDRALDRDLYDAINWPGFARFLIEMSMPTHEDIGTIVNFGDNWRAGSSAVSYWVAARERDGEPQWFGESMSREQDRWSLIWYDPEVPATEPERGPRLWHSDLDWIVARTGYGTDDLVVAMRSGPPGNHEHADRNSIIVKYAGEQLVADPERAPYTFTDPSWALRLTEGHSAVLIDGRGHQYHDGSEGTNASDAEAHIIDTRQDAGVMQWSSDATHAYKLVIPDVESVVRSVLVAHDHPVIVIADRVEKASEPSIIEARFISYNRDGNGRISSDDGGFDLHRPHASARGIAFSPNGAGIHAERLDIPEETAKLHPYAVARLETASLTPTLVTVLMLRKEGEAPAEALLTPEEDGTLLVQVSGPNGRFSCHVDARMRVPSIRVDEV